MDPLKQQVMVNQFVYVTGCRMDQATQYLSSSKWHFDAALSTFFEESNIPPSHSNFSSCHFETPMNTPVTPPSLPETITSFSKLFTPTEILKTTSNGLQPSQPPSHSQHLNKQ